MDVNDFCKCSFGVDNVVVFKLYDKLTGNFDIVNMYNVRKVKYIFVSLRQISLFTSNWVKVRDSCLMCKPVYINKLYVCMYDDKNRESS